MIQYCKAGFTVLLTYFNFENDQNSKLKKKMTNFFCLDIILNKQHGGYTVNLYTLIRMVTQGSFINRPNFFFLEVCKSHNS